MFGITHDTNMETLRIVLDTNILVAAFRSQLGASYKLLSLVDSHQFEVCLSVALVLEYEDVAKRMLGEISLDQQDVDDILDYLCLVSIRQPIHYLWRPFLPDPKDDMVLELAMAAQCSHIVTFNRRDFREVGQFGIEVVSPQEFLRVIGAFA